MNHLTDALANEYLDEALEPSVRRTVESHLETCASCQAKLAGLRSLSRMLAALPEKPLLHELSPSVQKKLAKGSFGLVWKLALAVQAGFVTGLLLLIAPLVTRQLSETVPVLVNHAFAGLLKLPGSLAFNPGIPTLPLPQMPAICLPAFMTSGNSSLWMMLGIAAGLLFIIGNFSLIFSRNPEDR